MMMKMLRTMIRGGNHCRIIPAFFPSSIYKVPVKTFKENIRRVTFKSVLKMTGETPEVRSDKRKPREDRQNQRYHRYHRKREKKREIKSKREKRREKKKNVEGQSLSTCIQFSILNSMMIHDVP